MRVGYMKYWEVLTLKVIKNFKRWYQDAKNLYPSFRKVGF